MKKNHRNAYNELKKAGAPVYTREDIEGFGITSEEANSHEWVDYWNGYKVWGSDTSPRLDEILRKHGLFAQCMNPGEWHTYEL